MERLAEGERLDLHGPLPSVNYALEYRMKKKSLVREVVERVTGRL